MFHKSVQNWDDAAKNLQKSTNRRSLLHNYVKASYVSASKNIPRDTTDPEIDSLKAIWKDAVVCFSKINGQELKAEPYYGKDQAQKKDWCFENIILIACSQVVKLPKTTIVRISII